ncbi:MAG: hypothetical protein ACM3SW_03585 [Actinomycetota bacterium]
MTDKFAIFTSGHKQDLNFPLSLSPGDRITDCSGIWAAPDTMADALSNCDACGRRTFRVVTITSAGRLQKRTALCGKHFIITAKVFPQLRSDYRLDA